MKKNENLKGSENLVEVPVQDATRIKSSKKGSKKQDASSLDDKEKTPISRIYDFAVNTQSIVFAGLCSQMVESWKVIKVNLKSAERNSVLRDFITAKNLSNNFTLQLERIPSVNENGDKTTIVGNVWIPCKVSTLAGIRSIINDAKLQLRRERITAKKELNSALYEKASKLLGMNRAKVDTLGISTVKDLIAKLG